MNRLLIGGLLAGFLAVLAIPSFRTLFDLVLPGPYAWAVIVTATAVAAAILKLALSLGRRLVSNRAEAEHDERRVAA